MERFISEKAPGGAEALSKDIELSPAILNGPLDGCNAPDVNPRGMSPLTRSQRFALAETLKPTHHIWGRPGTGKGLVYREVMRLCVEQLPRSTS
jgi:hypothetical protein